MSEIITLKEFKMRIRAAGYRYKTHVVDFGSMGLRAHRHLEILDKDGNFVCGAGANVYPQEAITDHPEAFRLINEYKGRVFDEEGDKVLF